MEPMPIQALADAAADALANSEEPVNGQVRPVPDMRSIRYYTTLGILDRPAMEGRTALYGERHLQQLIAIKRLQRAGLSLAEIQAKLHGISARALAEIAKLPPPREEKPRTKSTRPAFWKEEPATPSPPRAPNAQPSIRSIGLIGLELGEVTLLFRPGRTMDEADAAACREAAAPLLRVLEARGLIAPFEAERNDDG